MVHGGSLDAVGGTKVDLLEVGSFRGPPCVIVGLLATDPNEVLLHSSEKSTLHILENYVGEGGRDPKDTAYGMSHPSHFRLWE